MWTKLSERIPEGDLKNHHLRWAEGTFGAGIKVPYFTEYEIYPETGTIWLITKDKTGEDRKIRKLSAIEFYTEPIVTQIESDYIQVKSGNMSRRMFMDKHFPDWKSSIDSRDIAVWLSVHYYQMPYCWENLRQRLDLKRPLPTL